MQLQQLLEAMIAYMGGDARRIQHFIKVQPDVRSSWTKGRSLF
mgnify:CR=1 FL=1